MSRKSLHDMMFEHSNDDGYILDISTGERIDYGELYHRVYQRSAWLRSFPQQNICVVLPNGITFVELLLASFISDTVFCPISYSESDVEISRMIDFLEPAVVITDRASLINSENPQTLFTLPEKARKEPDGFSGDILFAPHKAAMIYMLSSPNDNRRAVMVSYENIQVIVSSMIESFGYTQDDSFLALLPFGHAAAIYYSLLPAIACGAGLVIAPGFEYVRTDFFTILGQYNISHCQVVPTILVLLVEFNATAHPELLQNLKFIGCGSAELHLSVQQKFMDHYDIPVANLYGLTETGPTHCDNPLENGWIPGSVGRPLPFNEVRLAEDGELLIRGKNLFIGYFKNESMYRQCFDGDWFKTGDLFRGDESGGHFFLKHKKALIIKGGMNIDPKEVEEIILELPAISACFAVGKYNFFYGEEVVAVVTPTEQMDSMDLQKLIHSHCREHLSPHKIPLEIIVNFNLPPWSVDAWHEIKNSVQ